MSQETADEFSLALDLEAPPIYYNKADYIQTASGNKVSRNSVLCGSQNISLVGNSVVKPGVVLRGDLQLLKIGKFVIIGDGCVLRPSYKKYKGNIAFFPMSIGDYVTIGPKSIVCAAQIGSCVDIGENCVISKRCILKDNSMILPNTILPPDTIVPPLTVFGGVPGRYLGDIPESQPFVQKEHAMTEYRRFRPTSKGGGGATPKASTPKAKAAKSPGSAPGTPGTPVSP
ncbi:dynE [Symbiodinium natans]|uniref:Dynactin subunit 5 n=1 Tax=Symbiodinium natans TaxID=878477 RepID=A0A812R0A9_9DINO|nr:dynE [Symbiodinium natans]